MSFIHSPAAQTYTPSLPAANPRVDRLPAGVYSVEKSRDDHYLQQIDPFVLPEKTYGKTNAHADRILKAFEREPRALGVLLAGEKGSGKTLLAKEIAVRSGLPTIVISAGYHDSDFFLFLQKIEQPAVILFDEFEKVYDDEAQDAILTLLDGVYPLSRKLIVLTVNSLTKVRDPLKNRPSRIRYMIEFEGLNSDFIKEYCADKLQNSAYLPDILRLALTCYTFNFDMLQAVVRELNEFGGKFNDMVEILNAKPPSSRVSSNMTWKYKVTRADAPEEKWVLDDNHAERIGPWACVERERGVCLKKYKPAPPKKRGRPNMPEIDMEVYVVFSTEGLTGIDANTGEVMLTFDGDVAGQFKVVATPSYAAAASFTVVGLE